MITDGEAMRFCIGEDDRFLESLILEVQDFSSLMPIILDHRDYINLETSLLEHTLRDVDLTHSSIYNDELR